MGPTICDFTGITIFTAFQDCPRIEEEKQKEEEKKRRQKDLHTAKPAWEICKDGRDCFNCGQRGHLYKVSSAPDLFKEYDQDCVIS